MNFNAYPALSVNMPSQTRRNVALADYATGQAAQQLRQNRQQSALEALYQQQGPQIRRGEQGALDAVSRINPAAALDYDREAEGQKFRKMGMLANAAYSLQDAPPEEFERVKASMVQQGILTPEMAAGVKHENLKGFVAQFRDIESQIKEGWMQKEYERGIFESDRAFGLRAAAANRAQQAHGMKMRLAQEELDLRNQFMNGNEQTRALAEQRLRRQGEYNALASGEGPQWEVRQGPDKRLYRVNAATGESDLLVGSDGGSYDNSTVQGMIEAERAFEAGDIDEDTFNAIRNKISGGNGITIGPDGTVQIGGAGGSFGRKAQSELEADTLGALDTISMLNDIERRFDPEIFTYKDQAQNWMANQAEKLGMDLSQTEQEMLTRRTDMVIRVGQAFNAYRKAITGAAAAVQELDQLKRTYINEDMGPTQFRAALTALKRMAQKDLRIKSDLARAGISQGDPSFMSEFNRRWIQDAGGGAESRYQQLIDDGMGKSEAYDQLLLEGY
ncbi:MAG: hypothetical protein AAFU68_03020 [Pseudomonadota bacterium]